MANEGNLDPCRSKSVARERGRKGGYAKAKKQRERRTLQEIAKVVLAMPMGKDSLEDIESMDFSQYRSNGLTVGEKAVLMAARKAIKGDISALTWLRDMAGEKPIDKVEINSDLAQAEAAIQARIKEMKERHKNDERG